MLKIPKILVVGSFMMDLIASTDRAPGPGETVIGNQFRTAPGGKGHNQAVQAARLGATVTMVGRVGGDDFGEQLLATAKAAGVDISHVSVDPETSSGVAHILLEVNDSGVQNRITVCPGSNYTLKKADVAWLQQGIREYDLVMLQFELPMEVIELVAQYAHDAGVPVMVNPAPAFAMSDMLLQNVTYLSPNEHEAAVLAGQSIDVSRGLNMEDLRLVCNSLHEQGVENLLITLGENGAVLSDRGGLHHIGSVKMPHVADPTAAGDSFVAAFCVGVTAGLTREQAATFASHTAAITVTRMGAIPSLPTIAEVQELLRARGCQAFDPAELDVLK